MRSILRSFLVMGIMAALTLGACGKGGDATAPEGEGAATPAATEKAAPPSKEDVAGLDCEKACTTQFDCVKKSGVNIPDEEGSRKSCVQACDMVKSIYDGKDQGQITAMSRFLQYATGSCE